jgi:hypothetical protein
MTKHPASPRRAKEAIGALTDTALAMGATTFWPIRRLCALSLA